MFQANTDGPGRGQSLSLWGARSIGAVLVLAIEQIDHIGKNIRCVVHLEAQAAVVDHIGALHGIDGSALIIGQ